MLPDNEGQKLKTFLLGTGTTLDTDPANFSMATTSDSSTIWTTLPVTQQPLQPIQNDKDAITAEIAAISEAYGSSSTTSLTSSVTSQYQYNPYPSTQYTMYTSANSAQYYQQMANLRAGTTAFPYSLTASSYYAGSYPVDYTSAAAAYQTPYYTNLRGGTTTPYYNPLNTAAAAYASVANSVLGSDVVNLGTSSDGSSGLPSSVGTFNLKEKKPKTSKKKKTGSCSPGDETYARVFIWDLEDVAVLSRNLLDSITHPQGYPNYTPVTSIARAATSMSDLMDRIAFSSFSDINEVREGDVTNIEDAVVDEAVMDAGPMDNLRGLDVMRRVAPKYTAFRQFYTDVSLKFKEEPGVDQATILNFELLKRLGLAEHGGELCQSALQLLGYNNSGQRWQCAQRCMDLVIEKSKLSVEKYANVVLSNEGVILGAAQLMIAGLNSAVPIENIYSVSKQGKESIFEKIQTRYGKKCSFICVTSSDTSSVSNTAHTAKRLSIPVWPLQSNTDLDKLYNAQDRYLLGG